MPKQKTPQETAKLQKARTESYAQRVKREYSEAVNSILALKKSVPKLDEGVMYSFDGDTKKVQSEVDKILRRLHSATLTTIKTGIETEWAQANKEMDSILSSALGKKALSNPQLAGWFNRNEKAMDAFLARSNEGMTLSDKVWKNGQQFRDEMEVAMTVAIGEGESASAMSRKVRQYLDDPDLMFRRFRYKDKNGDWQLKWKKRIKTDDGRYKFIDYDRNSYKTGAGVYKSSYRNAMRLTRTETNMAYRRADHDRWQQLDFVLGQHIEPSKTHDDLVKKAKNEDKAKDICDQLKGDYPKEFVFDGWHPQCLCICTAIMRSEEEMRAKMRATLRGEPYEYKEKPIDKYPAGFRKFVEDNKDSIAAAQKASTQPYFIKYNAGAVNDILGKEVVENAAAEDGSIVLSIQERAAIRHAQRTPERELELRRYWQDKVMKFTPEQLKNFDDIEKALGVKRGLMMTDAEADMQNANPNYGKDDVFSRNCQTCVPVYMLRKWGFNVTATGNTKDSVNKYISFGRSSDLWLNQNGSAIIYKTTSEWLRDKGGKRMTKRLYSEYFEEMTKDEGVYCLTIGWKGKNFGHVTILNRDSNGKLTNVEPQYYNGTVYRDTERLAQEGSAKPSGNRGIFRIDDKMFNINGKTTAGKSFTELFEP